MKFRASTLPQLMTQPINKSETLSKTAKSEIERIAKEDFYGFTSYVDSKPMMKGRECENTSIKLLNDVMFKSFVKNDKRVNTELLTGECDIYTPELIIDIKTSWSLETFPALPRNINPKDYEWQLRGYMYLYDVPNSAVVYCMVDTPEHLLNDWDNKTIHEVEHISIEKRVTAIYFERDLELEQIMLDRLKECQEYYVNYVNELNNK